MFFVFVIVDMPVAAPEEHEKVVTVCGELVRSLDANGKEMVIRREVSVTETRESRDTSLKVEIPSEQEIELPVIVHDKPKLIKQEVSVVEPLELQESVESTELSVTSKESTEQLPSKDCKCLWRMFIDRLVCLVWKCLNCDHSQYKIWLTGGSKPKRIKILTQFNLLLYLVPVVPISQVLDSSFFFTNGTTQWRWVILSLQVLTIHSYFPIFVTPDTKNSIDRKMLPKTFNPFIPSLSTSLQQIIKDDALLFVFRSLSSSHSTEVKIII